MARAQQRGSVVSFVVVGALLAALVLGGIYVVKNVIGGDLDGTTVDQVATTVGDSAKEAANDTKQAVDTATNNTDQEKAKTDAAKQQAAKDAEKKKADEQAAAEKKATEQREAQKREQEASAKAQASASDDELPQTGMSAVEELPQTGPADGLVAVVGVTLLTGAAIAYRRSSLL